ncbi:MAG: HlyD family efflux transporter periplasmic adaptor subunit [Planctomycetes bacterium]|nr:HlyD family efflux transporter periplasmic adaptor subunit [Planctomycetota bacterium]
MNPVQNDQFGEHDSSTASDLLQRLDRSDGNPAQFWANMLATLCFLGQADGGSIFYSSQQGRVDVLAVYPEFEKGATPPAWLLQSAESAPHILAKGTVVVKPLMDSPTHGHSAQKRLVMMPMKVPDIGKAVAAFLIVTDDKAILEASSMRLQLSVNMIGYIQAALGQQTRQGGLKRLQQAMETLSATNSQGRFVGAAMAFCNEIASRWQCERASVGFLEGKYVRLKAMSHTEDFGRKMKVVQDIESAMEECLDQDVEILGPASDQATYVSRAAGELSRRHGPLTILSLPLRRDGETVAVLTLERQAGNTFNPEEIETIRLACELCTARLINLYEHNRWIGAKIASKTHNLMAGLLGPKHTLAKVIVVLFLAALLFLIFARGQFRAEAPFVLEATYQQVVPAPFDGYIKGVEVEVGEEVEGNSSTLATLDTAELRLKLAAAKAEKAGYLKQASAAMRDNETAQAQIAQANADKADAQIDLLNFQISQSALVSPMSGIVVKGDLKRQIGAPVKTGDILFEVCPLESLRAQLMVPEDLILYIETGDEGKLATASYPGKPIRFVVERVNPMAETIKQRNVFKVRVRLLETFPWMRPGMEGVAKVSVGKRRYIWIWTRKVTNWIRMKLWL